MEEYHLGEHFLLLTFFLNPIFKALHFLKLGPFLSGSFFYQWPKLCIGLNVKADMQILKGILPRDVNFSDILSIEQVSMSSK